MISIHRPFYWILTYAAADAEQIGLVPYDVIIEAALPYNPARRSFILIDPFRRHGLERTYQAAKRFSPLGRGGS
jgi:hypothetical protein